MADASKIDINILRDLAASDSLVEKKLAECLKSGEELREALTSYKDSHQSSVEELLDIRIIRDKVGEITGYYIDNKPTGKTVEFLSVPDHGLRNKIDERVRKDVNICTQSK